jgi:hypothetical protein
MDIEAMKLWRQVFVTMVKGGISIGEAKDAANYAMEGFMKAFIEDRAQKGEG